MFEPFKQFNTSMSGLKNMQARLNYYGGASQKERMRKDKAWSLDKALSYSYQAETAILADAREFRCLINPNKLSMELDDKMLSIPFEDICLTSNKREPIGVKVGDVLTWKENETHWLVYMQYLQEDAYFRGLMRQCDTEVEIGGNRYWVYLKGPSEKTINWQKTSSFVFNKLNYTLEMYISNTPETNEFFQRFTKLKIKGKPWEVQAVDRLTTEGIIGVYLKEDYSNEFEEEPKVPEVEEEVPEVVVPEVATFRMRRAPTPAPSIKGPDQVYPFDIHTYTVENSCGGVWSLSNKRAKIISQTESSVEVEIISGKSGDVSLIYTFGGEKVVYNITIKSL